MNQTWLLLTIVFLAVGCSSDSNKPKYEAADNSSAGETASDKKGKKKVPDWMKGQKSNEISQKSVSTEGAKSKLADSNQKNPNTTITDPVKQVTPNQKKPTTKNTGTTKGSGEATALMAKLLESYDKSVKFYQEKQTQKMTQEEFLASRETYAKMIEEWLAIADKMIEMDLRLKDRLAVIALKKMAHESLANFNRPEHEQKLYDFGETLKDETNNDIRKIYQVIKLKQPLTKIVRGESIDEQKFIDRFDKFVSFWRDDYEVYQNVENWLNQIYPANRDIYVKTLTIAEKHFTESLDTQVMARSDSLKDRLLAVNLGFDLAVAGVLREEPGATKTLLETSSRMLAQPKLSLNSILQIIQAGYQLESIGDYMASKRYFDQISEATKSYTNPKVKETIQVYLDAAKTRHELLGKPIKVEGMVPKIEKGEFVRKPLDFSSYRGKVVVLFFWAAENPLSYQTVEELDKFFMANQDKDLALIGVNVDRRMEIISQVMQMELMKRKRKWTHLMPPTPKVLGLNSTMAKRCGVDQLPFNLVIDQKGNVDSFRVYGFRLQETVSRLLGKPVNEIYKKPSPKESKKEDSSKSEAKKDGSENVVPEKSKPAKAEAKKIDIKKEDGKKNNSKQPESETPKAKTADPKLSLNVPRSVFSVHDVVQS